MKSIAIRALSGIIYIALIIGCLWSGWEAMSILVAFFAAFGMIEMLKMNSMLSKKNLSLNMLDIAGTALLTLCFMGFELISLWLIALFIRFILEIYSHDENPVKSLAISIFGQIYVGLPLLLLNILDYSLTIRADQTALTTVMSIFIFIWLNDTGAFLVGCMLGKHKLFPRLSPKKSWEGFWGGLIFTIGGSVFLSLVFPEFIGISFASAIGLALVVTIFSTWGDLFESMIKRALKTKDSGKIMPGHGGILDRIDSLLFVAPAATLYLAIVILFL